MITPQEILESLAATANSWKAVAVFWHVVGLVLLASILAGPFQPRQRLAPLLTVPLLSVSVFAWAGDNFFNGAMFLIAGIALLLVGISLKPAKCHRADPAMHVVGAALILFALVYPHFVNVSSTWQYLLYAPVGLLPCPTLSLVIGASIMLNGFESRAWSFTLAGFGLFYGMLGALWLGVHLDWVLVAGSLALFVKALRGGEPA